MAHNSIKVHPETFSGSDGPLARALARPLVRFMALEAASGILLLAATVVALVWVNSPWGESYHHLWETELSIDVGAIHLHEPLEGWVNDALMVIFFFVVGLEIKTEMVVGDLRDPRQALLPAVAALGGMLVPAGLFLALNAGGSAADGWGIPMATDIAFAVGVLAILGRSVPPRLKLFLLALAIADDIGAILVIAVFYTSDISLGWLAAAVGALVAVVAMRLARIWYVPLYLLVGVFVWYATFESGVHATIAGVVLGLLTPARPLLGVRSFEWVQDILAGDTADPASLRDVQWRLRETEAVASRLLGLLTPWTGFFIVPVFALANAGVELSLDGLRDAASAPVSLGIVAGLVLGKPIGITLFTLGSVKLGLASLPPGVGVRHVIGGGAVAGIGFTVALFITGLAFVDDPVLRDQATIGVLVASLTATVVGGLILRSAPASARETEATESVLV